MMTSDLALLGRLGDHVVAASALAHTCCSLLSSLGMGIVSAVSPLASQAFGARQPRMVRRALRVGLWAATLLGMPLSVSQLYGEQILLALGQTPDAAALAALISMALPGALCRPGGSSRCAASCSRSTGPNPDSGSRLRPFRSTALLAYALIYGEFGLPRLEMLGAGLATTIVNIGMCVAAVWVCYASRPFKKYRDSRPLLEPGLDAVRRPVRDWRADLGHNAAGVRSVRAPRHY